MAAWLAVLDWQATCYLLAARIASVGWKLLDQAANCKLVCKHCVCVRLVVSCHPCRVALRCVANGIAARSMQLLVRHSELREAAGQPLLPGVWREHVHLSVGLLASAMRLIAQLVQEATGPSATAASAAAAASAGSEPGRAALQAAERRLRAASRALWQTCERAEQQGLSYQLSDWKALIASKLPHFEAEVAAWRSLVVQQHEAAASGGNAWPALTEPPSQQQLLGVAAALTTRPGCSNLRCTNCTGADEQGMPRGRRCSGCHTLRFCSAACQREAWPAHRVACRLLSSAAAGVAGS